MQNRRRSKPSRSLLDHRHFQHVPASAVDQLLETVFQQRMGLVAEARNPLPVEEELWVQFVFTLLAIEGICGDQDFQVLLDIRIKDLARLKDGKLSLRRGGGQWWLDISWQTRLAGLLYLASLSEVDESDGDKLILPATWCSADATGTPLQQFGRWLKQAAKAAGLPPLSVNDLREAAKLWQLRHRRSYVAAARQGVYMFDPPEPVITMEELCSLSRIELPDTDLVLKRFAAVITK